MARNPLMASWSASRVADLSPSSFASTTAAGGRPSSVSSLSSESTCDRSTFVRIARDSRHSVRHPSEPAHRPSPENRAACSVCTRRAPAVPPILGHLVIGPSIDLTGRAAVQSHRLHAASIPVPDHACRVIRRSPIADPTTTWRLAVLLARRSELAKRYRVPRRSRRTAVPRAACPVPARFQLAQVPV